jgi:hypothetical protein
MSIGVTGLECVGTWRAIYHAGYFMSPERGYSNALIAASLTCRSDDVPKHALNS